VVFYWNLPHYVYELIAPLMEYPVYNDWIFQGLIISCGCRTESVKKYSQESFTNFLKVMGQQGKSEVLKNLVAITMDQVNQHRKYERIGTPLFKTIAIMFKRNEITNLKGVEETVIQLKDLLKLTLKYTKSTNRLIAAIHILVEVLNVSTLDMKTKGELWRMIINLLFHKFPIVSKNTADAFYMYTMTQGEDEFGEDPCEELQDILIEQDWLEMTDKQKSEVKAEIEKVLGDKLPQEAVKEKAEKEEAKTEVKAEEANSGDDEI